MKSNDLDPVGISPRVEAAFLLVQRQQNLIRFEQCSLCSGSDPREFRRKMALLVKEFDNLVEKLYYEINGFDDSDLF